MPANPYEPPLEPAESRWRKWPRYWPAILMLLLAFSITIHVLLRMVGIVVYYGYVKPSPLTGEIVGSNLLQGIFNGVVFALIPFVAALVYRRYRTPATLD